jgi:(p)ppGpp synthase/HD superfamily hydrolase
MGKYEIVRNFAVKAHEGQMRRGDEEPYVCHPIRVAEMVKERGGSEEAVLVALLHDVVEDTEVTLAELEQAFPPAVTEAVCLLTHDKSVDYYDYVRNLKPNVIAKKVKLADLAHNSDEIRSKAAGCSEKQILHWREKYSRAKEILLSE